MAHRPAKFVKVFAGLFLCLAAANAPASSEASPSPGLLARSSDSSREISSPQASSPPARSSSGAGAGVEVAQPKRSSSIAAPGVGPTTLTLGSLAPVHGANAEAGAAVQAVLTAYFNDLNEQGGIHNRRIEMRFADAGSNSATAVRNARQLMHGPVFALVAPFVPGAEGALAGLAHENKVPTEGVLALSVPDDPANREVFYLLPGFEQLVQELGRYAVQQQKLEPAKSAVIFADEELRQELSPSLKAMWKEFGAALPAEFVVSDANRAQLVRDLKQQGTEAIFLPGGTEEIMPWIQAAGEAQWYPKLFLLGPLLDDSVLNAPAQLQGRMFAVYPALEPSLEGLAEFDSFLERHHLSNQHRLLSITAYCAARVLETALVRAGKNLTREKLLLELERLRDFRTGLVPPITFGPDRRIGSRKAEFVCADLLTHAFEPSCSRPTSGK